MVSRYDVCLEKYMDLLVRLRSGTISEDTKPMRMTRRSISKKNLNNTHILLNTTKYRIGLTHVFTYFLF